MSYKHPIYNDIVKFLHELCMIVLSEFQTALDFHSSSSGFLDAFSAGWTLCPVSIETQTLSWPVPISENFMKMMFNFVFVSVSIQYTIYTRLKSSDSWSAECLVRPLNQEIREITTSGSVNTKIIYSPGFILHAE